MDTVPTGAAEEDPSGRSGVGGRGCSVGFDREAVSLTSWTELSRVSQTRRSQGRVMMSQQCKKVLGSFCVMGGVSTTLSQVEE